MKQRCRYFGFYRYMRRHCLVVLGSKSYRHVTGLAEQSLYLWIGIRICKRYPFWFLGTLVALPRLPRALESL